MTFTTSLSDVRELARADDDGKRDQIVRARQITMHHGRLWLPDSQADGFDAGLAMSEWATAQACQKLGIPGGYFKKCPNFLKDAQWNHWVQREENLRSLTMSDDEASVDWMLRTKGSLVRGVLSPKYAKLDNSQVLDTLLPMVGNSRFKVGLVELNPESFHLRLIDPTIWRDVIPGDRLLVGIHLCNSEVGLRAVTVDAVVWRQVCSNGLVRKISGKSLMRQRHIHVAEARLESLLADALSQAIAVAAAFIEQMVLSVRIPVPDPERAIAYLGQLWGLSKQTQEYIKFGLYGERHSETLYGLVNAVTNAAQRLSVEGRYELEGLASVLIDTTDTSREGHALRQRILTPKALVAV